MHCCFLCGFGGSYGSWRLTSEASEQHSALRLGHWPSGLVSVSRSQSPTISHCQGHGANSLGSQECGPSVLPAPRRSHPHAVARKALTEEA